MGGGLARKTRPWIDGGLTMLGVLCLVWVYLQREKAASQQRSAMQELAEFRTAAGQLPGESGSERRRSSVFGSALIGVLEIPRVRVSVAVFDGDDDKTLSVAVGHLPDTPLPWHVGNSAMAGHRDTFFRPLKNLRVGDTMRMATFHGDFHYRVRRILIVAPRRRLGARPRRSDDQPDAHHLLPLLLRRLRTPALHRSCGAPPEPGPSIAGRRPGG